jgi:hypothetical protein
MPLKKYIRDIQDFQNQGVFKDITPLLLNQFAKKHSNTTFSQG